jgi:hypothetical protein
MPIRGLRRRKDTGLRKFIVQLYTIPVMRLLYDPEYEPIRDLIYGPSTSHPSPELLARLNPLWQELREDILTAQAEYMPHKKPWGCRFDHAPSKIAKRRVRGDGGNAGAVIQGRN